LRSLGFNPAFDVNFDEVLRYGSFYVLVVVRALALNHAVHVVEAGIARPDAAYLKVGCVGHELEHRLLLMVLQTIHIKR